MYGFEDVTAWFPVAIKPVRHGLYDVVTYEGGPVRQAQWADGWSDGLRTRVDVECWRGLRAGAAASEFERLLSAANKTIETMRAEHKFCRQQLAIDASSRESLANRLDEAQQKLRNRRDESARRVQQLQASALEAIELIGRLHGSVIDPMPMVAAHIDKALEAIKRALFPPIE